MITTKPSRMPDRPTNRDLMVELYRFHECLHSVGKTVEDLGSTLQAVQLDVEHVKGVQEGITTRLGVPNTPPAQVEEEGGRPVKKALIMGNMSKPQLAFALLGAMSGIAIAYRILSAVIAAAWPAFHRAMMAAV